MAARDQLPVPASARSRVAAMWQALATMQVAASLAWLAWRWPYSPVQALLGAAVILSIGPIVLALEFALLAIVGRADTELPRPRFAELVLAWWGECRHLYLVFYWRMAFRWRTPADQLDSNCRGRPGVVFIHGFACNRGFWRPWLKLLQGRGHAFVAVNLEPVTAPIDDHVAAVDAAVQRVATASGQPPLLVCHSMGGLVARAWLRQARDARRVTRVITIASPHAGTWMGRFSRTLNGQQVRLSSAWLRQLERDEATLARPPWTCWYTDCDNIVFPVATARLPGADNRCRRGVAHVALAYDPDVMQETFAFLAVPDPGRSV